MVNEFETKRKSLARALFFGFMPLAVIVGLFAVLQTDIFPIVTTFWQHLIAKICCVASLCCCVIASVTLFRRKTALAFTGGLVLLLLNAFIAFCFGWAAIVQF